ncbi:MAG: rsbV [Anaerospora sp.]|nr:rsbV [Anaerospora sp.]
MLQDELIDFTSYRQNESIARRDVEMRQEINIQDGQVFVSLYGSLYVEEAAVLRQKLLMNIDKGYSRFIVNMANVDYIDSSQ